MKFDTEQFITEIQQNECIWNKQLKSHHDLQQLHVGWTNVARTCIDNFEGLEDRKKTEKIKKLKIKWKNIRDAYRKKCISKSGQAAKTSNRYIYANILEFVRPTMENRKTDGNIIESDVDEKDTDEKSILVAKTGVENDESPMIDSEEELPIQPKKKNYKNYFEHKLLTLLENRNFEDPVTLFLMSLAPQIRSLTQDQQNEVYLGFITTIQRVKNSNNLNQSQLP